ncbi:MAG: HAMP domain-containing histidine kinase, partial [Caldilineaceae bacterium]|nr:HAMP domain-containing histidine kinase [Caldilineaceae bacterium]
RLSVILGYAEALSDGKLQGSAEMFTVIHQEANHLNHLIDDLRTLSLADAGELHLHPIAVAPGDCLARAAAAHQGQAAEQHVTLRVDASDDLSEIWVDPERIAQVLGNLVSNALRHTPVGGEIVLGAHADGEHVLLSVADTGPGIAPEELAQHFRTFLPRRRLAHKQRCIWFGSAHRQIDH